MNKLARRIVDEATRDEPPADDGKDPAAVALGRKGGKARAERMSAEERSQAAKKAAAALAKQGR